MKGAQYLKSFYNNLHLPKGIRSHVAQTDITNEKPQTECPASETLVVPKKVLPNRSIVSKTFDSYKFLTLKCIDSIIPLAACDGDDDDDDNDDEVPSLIKEADEAIEKTKHKISTPIQFENVKPTISQGIVHPYDGFRMIVQKQVNLQTVVSHFYWIGSQQLGRSIYQYRVILPLEEDNVLNCSIDGEQAVEGEWKIKLSKNVLAKASCTIGEQNSLTGELEYTDECSASQLQYHLYKGANVSYMQSITPFLRAGGAGSYSFDKNHTAVSLGGYYDKDDQLVGLLYDTKGPQKLQVLYLKKVNPNRVHLATTLNVDQKDWMNSEANISAEFQLKASKLHMSIDSNAVVKSTLDASIGGATLQFQAQTNQIQEQYLFGMGIIIS